MHNFIKIVFLLLLLLFTGCLERQKKPTVFQPLTYQNAHNPFVNEAYKHLGKPYKYGATGPNRFDCSGFVYAVHRALKVQIPRTSLNQSKISGHKIARHHLKVGDLVFFDTSSRGHVNHSGIYLGGGKFIHASSGKAFSVTISDINAWYKDKFKWGKRIDANQ